jgi:hypothetical protein
MVCERSQGVLSPPAHSRMKFSRNL